MRISRFVRHLRGPVLFTVLSLCLLVIDSSVGSAQGYGGTAAGSPVRSATVPLSSYRSGVVSRPNPLDNSANRVVTGNVGAGKHFRGPMPYGSTTSLSAPLGSTSLDSFMRYTAPPATPRTSAGTYGSYYSPTRTATSTLPGTRSVSNPGALRIGTGTAPKQNARTGGELYSNLPAAPSWPSEAGALQGNTRLDAAPRLQLWPGSTPDPAGRNIPKRFGEPLTDGHLSPPRTETVTGGDYKQQMEALQQRLGAVQSELSALEQGLATRDDPSLASPTTNKVSGTFSQPMPRPDVAAKPKKALDALGTGEPDMREAGSRKDELLQETARLLSTTTGSPAPGVLQDSDAPWDTHPSGGSILSTDTQTRLQLYRPDTALPQARNLPGQSRFKALDASPVTARVEAKSRAFNPSGALARPNKVTEPARSELTVIQPSVQGPAWKLDTEKAASSLKSFERHLKTARQHAQQGRYVQAANAFTLAAAYQPNSPASYLGKSHALLAAGEYLGSALALTKAVELDATYALQKSDLIWIAGGPDAFIARFNTLDEALQAGATGHLQFLVAYIYHQMDRPREARVAIEGAQTSLPASKAINSLRAAIESSGE